MAHSSIVLPHMDYASIVWWRCPNMINNDRMSKLQKRVARVILRCKIRDISSKDLFNTVISAGEDIYQDCHDEVESPVFNTMNTQA